MAGWRGPILGRRHEFQCGTIDTISKAGRFWAVLEDVALMALAASAMDFGARENQFEVRAAVEFVFRGIDGQVAAGALVHAGFFIVVQGMGERTLSRLMSQYLIGVWREELFPFVVRFDDLCDRSDVYFLGHRGDSGSNKLVTIS